MADLLKVIPLPLARPHDIEDVQVGELESQVGDVYSYSQSWYDWVIERKEEMKEKMVQFYGWLEDTPRTLSVINWEDFLLALGGISLVAILLAPIVYLVYIILKKINS